MIKRYSFHIDEYNSSIKEDSNGEYVKYEDVKSFIKEVTCSNKHFVSSSSNADICFEKYTCDICTNYIGEYK